jgi:PEP-CTERM motif
MEGDMLKRHTFWSTALTVWCLAVHGAAPAQTITDGRYTITRTTGTYTSIVGSGAIQFPTSGNDADDEQSAAIPLGFTFNLYGVAHTTASVCTNGFLSLPASTVAEYQNAALNSLGTTGVGATALIAPFWDDLYFPGLAAGALLTLTRSVAGHQEFVAEWDRVGFFDGPSSTASFQAVLRDNGTMSFFYPDAGVLAGHAGGISATIGVRGAAGMPTQGAEWSFDTASVTSGDVLNITPVPEPTALALAGLGLFGLAIRSRRK